MKKILLVLIIFFNFQNSNAESKFAYININLILNNSVVGQSITEHIKELKEKKVIEFKIIEKKLSEKEEIIKKKKNIIDQNEFNNEVNLLKEELADYKKKKKKLFLNEIDKKKIKYTKILLNSLNPIISKYVEENSIMIVFPKKNIIMAKKNLDITKQIMDLLNSELKQIDF